MNSAIYDQDAIDGNGISTVDTIFRNNALIQPETTNIHHVEDSNTVPCPELIVGQHYHARDLTSKVNRTIDELIYLFSDLFHQMIILLVE